MRLLCELSGEHPSLPAAELESVGEVLENGRQVAVVECPDPSSVSRLALTHTAMEILGSCDASSGAFAAMLAELAITSPVPFAGRVKKVHGTRMDASQLELERMIGNAIDGPVSLKGAATEYRAVCSGNRCYFGRVVARIDRSAFECRNPMRRPFFHPGVMMPRVARALVNISLAGPGDLFCDPFCGTGGILLEAHLLGMHVIGSDMDPRMAYGSHHNIGEADIVVADAGQLPLSTASVDAVVTDLPYGQSVRIRGFSLENLYIAAIEEIRRVLRPGRRAVIVTHRDIREIASGIMTVAGQYDQRVHKSLTRHIMVLRSRLQ